MDVSDLAMPVAWGVAAWVVALVVLAAAARRAPWDRVLGGTAAQVVPAAVLVLCLLWALRARIGDAFTFHLLGTAALALTVGPALALVSGAVVVGVMTVVRAAPLLNAGMVWLTSVALPVGVATAVLAIAQRRLPANFFVYVFVACFFGTALAFGASGLASALVTVVAGGRSADVVFGEYVPFLLYLAFGEATLTGMWLTLAVVYHPAWVATFDDRRYLRAR